MNGLTTAGDRRMTVKEVADALGYKPDTIQGKVKELFPALVKNGIATTLTMVEVDIIKQNLVPRNLGLKSEVDSAVTDIEMKRKALEVMQWMASQVEAEKAARIAAEEKALALLPKAAAHDALMSSENTMSITDAGKHFGLHPRTQVFPYLRDARYLTNNDLPTQAAIDAGYLSMKEVLCPDGEIRRRAVVEARQLEIWRTRVVPQIKRWEAVHA
jgi:phage antirepressor YoqD-like protein